MQATKANASCPAIAKSAYKCVSNGPLGSFIMYTYLHISHRAPIYPHKQIRDMPEYPCNQKPYIRKRVEKEKWTGEVPVKVIQRLDQLDVSKSTSHQPDIEIDPSDSLQEIYEK